MIETVSVNDKGSNNSLLLDVPGPLPSLLVQKKSSSGLQLFLPGRAHFRIGKLQLLQGLDKNRSVIAPGSASPELLEGPGNASESSADAGAISSQEPRHGAAWGLEIEM